MNQTIQQWLQEFLPIPQIQTLSTAVTPYFIALGISFALWGLYIMLAGSEGNILGPYMRAGAIVVIAIVASSYCLQIVENIINHLVLGIGSKFPDQLNWLVVNNAQGNVTMDYTKPFKAIGAFIAGSFTATPNNPLDWGAWVQYLVRIIIISCCSFVAIAAVFIMELLLLVQQAITALSGPLIPMFVGCLALPQAHSTAMTFFRQVIGVLCWPVGWAVGNIATVAALQNLKPPNWSAGLEDIIGAGFAFGVVCVFLIAVAAGAPGIIFLTVTRGSNFAQHLAGSVASSMGQHAARNAQSIGAVGGALVGSSGGPAGALAGSQMGSKVGRLLAEPLQSSVGAIERATGGKHIISTSRSHAAGAAAVKAIIKRA